jgi:ABC-type dipeptide/oligopeptide/nickel transport system ATPase subunit
VLKGVSFSIAAGECVALVGRSGSGKSTLAKCLTGLERYEAGSVSIDGRPHLPSKRAARRQVQMVWQDSAFALCPFTSVATAIREPMDAFDIGSPDAVAGLLEQVGLSALMTSRFPHQLSGGEAQRVGIARALAAEPRVLVLDEPLSALDPPTQASIVPVLRSASRRDSRAVLFISHDLTAVRQLADRVLFLENGVISLDQQMHDFFASPGNPAAEAFLAAWGSLPF